MIKKLLFIVLLACTIKANVYLYHNDNPYASYIAQELTKHQIPFELTNTIEPQSKNLYILVDILSIREPLPEYYIGYQSQDITKKKLSSHNRTTLSNAIAVWDYNYANIERYKKQIPHYYYFPSAYEFADPVLLVCLLPSSAFTAYKAILSYSNQLDTDISSHLPTLFCHALLQNPSIMVEAGVRGGESTKVFSYVLKLSTSNLIGLDIDRTSQQVYESLANASFWCMNDLNFASFYATSTYQNHLIDFIFVDTSHLYEHTLQELDQFVPLLSSNGTISFHDSNINDRYIRLNGSSGSAPRSNTRGVTHALKEFFNITFDEYAYNNFTFEKNAVIYRIIHYPFCNGLTIIKKEMV